jgi:hypothetical protein
MIKKSHLKRILGDLPLTAEIYWQLRQNGKPLNKNFSMQRTKMQLPIWVGQAAQSIKDNRADPGRSVLLFATLRYWIEHAALLSTALAGMGHRVTFAYLPFANWHAPINRFDMRRNNAYAQSELRPAEAIMRILSLTDVHPSDLKLPGEIQTAIEQISTRDVQYTLQIEDIDKESDLYQLRLERNQQATRAAFQWIQGHRPDILLTPNGSILEMGVVYTVARYLGIPVVTYEFGEQRDRIWLAHDAEVMRQETDQLWVTRRESSLSESQWEQIRALFSSRQQADLWGNFARKWQGIPSKGGEQARQELGLDSRPVVLLAANVIGDSLTLGRQVFTENMTRWLERTVLDFSKRNDTQLIVRIHPGERYTRGPSVADVVGGVLPKIPDHIYLVAADAPVNTYDLVEIADLGLVYTTTVGLEMAMSGVPVIVIGQTHYRSKGFTLDPNSWESYQQILDHALEEPAKYQLSREQVENAWNYAYRFFFEYPCPFPWHLLAFWDELKSWSVERVLSTEGQARYGDTFRYLVGEHRNWEKDYQFEGDFQQTLAGLKEQKGNQRDND